MFNRELILFADPSAQDICIGLKTLLSGCFDESADRSNAELQLGTFVQFMSNLDRALPSDNLHLSNLLLNDTVEQFKQNQFDRASVSYRGALDVLTTGVVSRVSCVKRQIGKQKLLVWAPPQVGERVATFGGVSYWLEADGERYLAWALAYPLSERKFEGG